MSKPFVLLKFECNWADELDVYGFLVVPMTYWTARQAAIKSLKQPLHLSVGTNEILDWDSGSELLQHINATSLTTEQAELLSLQFPVTHARGNEIASFGASSFLEEFYEGD